MPTAPLTESEVYRRLLRRRRAAHRRRARRRLLVRLSLVLAAGMIGYSLGGAPPRPLRHTRAPLTLSSTGAGHTGIAPSPAAPAQGTLIHLDGWGQPIRWSDAGEFVTFRSAGADANFETPDDLVLLVSRRRHATMFRGARAWTGSEPTRATHATLAALGDRFEARMPPRASTRTSRALPVLRRRVETGARRLEATARDWAAEGMAAYEGGASSAPDATELAPHATPEDTSVPVLVRTLLQMGAVRRETHAIADAIRAQYHGAWPDAVQLPAGDAGVDPWGTAYRYERDGALGFALRSAGPDGRWHTDDDPVLRVAHDGTAAFAPHWSLGRWTLGLDALTGQFSDRL